VTDVFAPTVEGAIELVLPADTRLVRLARLVASGVAATAGFDVEQIEDLRVAVDEGCAALIEGGDGSPLLLSFQVDGGGLEIVGSTTAADVAGFEPDRLTLSDQILRVVVDEHELATDHGRAGFRLLKRRSDSGDGADGG
jgi:serine/threonine-protein kinase RsbW